MTDVAARPKPRRLACGPEIALAVVALLPFVVWFREFERFFFFGDDWDHLDQIDRQGLPSWIWTVFAENFVPFWKLLWGGMVQLSGGSHPAMLATLWVTHALVAAASVHLIRRLGLSVGAAAAAGLLVALPATNIETLTWTTQWTTVLATLAFLVGLLTADQVARRGPGETTRRTMWSLAAVLVAASAASAFSMVRGVVAGPAFAAVLAFPCHQWSATLRRRAPLIVAALAPTVVTVLVVFANSRGNHQAIGGHAREMLDFGWYYFALNPLHRLLDFGSFGWRTTWLLGSVKLGIIGLALVWADRRTRVVLAALLLANLAEAILLGVGRFHTGLGGTTSSRYQYLSLVLFAPSFAVVIDRGRACAREVLHPWILRSASVVALVAMAWFFAWRWPRDLPVWAHHRGTVAREVIARPNPPDEVGAIPGIGYLTTTRAKELVERFELN
ncbi:hypothetical protein ASA1KI_45590 [Opitutales bacterium ASA1]|uniref:hypothetical protein n=1 Tax=Congregicoccus parvus TaxID=3081749 RepID=UPI002B2B74AA|nr:hypothetical protein ASA1KI_45590 [Opitutales bacterium ASA1]